MERLIPLRCRIVRRYCTEFFIKALQPRFFSSVCLFPV